jgi:hypothetical protein
MKMLEFFGHGNRGPPSPLHPYMPEGSQDRPQKCGDQLLPFTCKYNIPELSKGLRASHNLPPRNARRRRGKGMHRGQLGMTNTGYESTSCVSDNIGTYHFIGSKGGHIANDLVHGDTDRERNTLLDRHTINFFVVQLSNLSIKDSRSKLNRILNQSKALD